MQQLETEANAAFDAIGNVDFTDPDQQANVGKMVQEALLKVVPYLAHNTYAQVSEKDTIARQLEEIRGAGATPAELVEFQQMMARPNYKELFQALKFQKQLKNKDARPGNGQNIKRANTRGIQRAAGKRPLSSIAGVGAQPATLPKLDPKYEQANRLLGTKFMSK